MKHDDYDNPARIEIKRVNESNYLLSYPDEGYELYGTADEILAEIGEHIELIKM